MYICRDDWRVWGPELAFWLDTRFNRDVLDRFDLSVDPDCLTWLDQQQANIDGRDQDSVELFGQMLRYHYRGVKVFHATRLTNLDAVRRHGLRAWSAQDLKRQAHAMYGKTTEEEKLRRAIELNMPEHRGGRVYSFASLNHALGTHQNMPGKLPSFALNGGEFLACIGKQNGVKGNGEQQDSGRGYFLACNLPWDCLESRDFHWLSKGILLDVITCRFFDTNEYSMFGDRECISTMCDIPPDNIELVSDVEELRQRNNLDPSDITWQSFQQ